MGLNGQTAASAAQDAISFAKGGGLYELANSAIAASGSGVAANLAGTDTLTLTGSAETVTAGGTGDIVSLGGNGKGATNANDDIVTFAAAGTLNVQATSRVDAWGSGLNVNLAGGDVLGVYGSGDAVNTGKGSGDAIWIGLNGQSASGKSTQSILSSPAVR